jgi:hypothetical protein
MWVKWVVDDMLDKIRFHDWFLLIGAGAIFGMFDELVVEFL